MYRSSSFLQPQVLTDDAQLLRDRFQQLAVARAVRLFGLLLSQHQETTEVSIGSNDWHDELDLKPIQPLAIVV